jgi:hypothetical protein
MLSQQLVAFTMACGNEFEQQTAARLGNPLGTLPQHPMVLHRGGFPDGSWPGRGQLQCRALRHRGAQTARWSNFTGTGRRPSTSRRVDAGASSSSHGRDSAAPLAPAHCGCAR